MAGSFPGDPSDFAFLPQESGVEVLQMGGEQFLVGTSVAPEPQGSSLPGWVLHVMVSTDAAYADVTLLRTRFAFLAGAILAGALALSAFGSSRWIVRPIKRVTAVMREASHGKTDVGLGGDGKSDAIWEMLRSISVFLDQHRLLRKHEKVLNAQNIRFDTALTTMSQGLAMFDSNARLVLCNNRLKEFYALPSELCEAGATLQQISEHVASTSLSASSALFLRPQGTLSDDIAVADFFEMPDGRTIAIKHELMAGGGWLSILEDITERRKAEERIAHLARHDPLTNLPNRTMLRSKIEDALKLTKRGESFTVLCLDLDYFKSVNDTLGHAIGDALLCAVGNRLRGCLRENDLVARLGGDEFALIQVDTDQPNSSTVLAQRVIDALSAAYEIDEHQILIGASVGIAIAPGDGSNPDQIMKSADMALYRAKAEGRGRHRFFESDMDARMQARRKREIDLRTALANGEFELHYQPVVNLETNRITSFEALLHWNHPRHGTISPSEFIPLAEQIGLTIPRGDWVLHQACTDAASWPEPVRIAVNLSLAQFKNPDLMHSVFRALAKSKLAPQRLELEITEAVFLQDSEATFTTLHHLRDMGVRIAIDDFGTGHFSLRYLRSFLFDKIKIDQSFVRDLATRSDSAVIVRAVTTIGNSLGMTTTAEGVEDAAQLETLRDEGCTEVQGFLLGRPLPIRETTVLLQGYAGDERYWDVCKLAS